MIHVSPAPEPPSFHEKVRIPGRRSIKEMVGKKVTDELRRTASSAFKQRTRKTTDADGKTTETLVTDEADLPPDAFHPYWTDALDDLMT